MSRPANSFVPTSHRQRNRCSPGYSASCVTCTSTVCVERKDGRLYTVPKEVPKEGRDGSRTSPKRTRNSKGLLKPFRQRERRRFWGFLKPSHPKTGKSLLSPP